MSDKPTDDSTLPPALRGRVPLPTRGKHPLRCAIQGDTHLVPELKKIVQATSIPDSLKAFLATELDNQKDTGAAVHLHLVDHADGGVSLQLHIKPVHLGPRG